MSAKILAFDPNRRVPPRHYTPIAIRGRLLVMPVRQERNEQETSPFRAFFGVAVAMKKSGANQ